MLHEMRLQKYQLFSICAREMDFFLFFCPKSYPLLFIYNRILPHAETFFASRPLYRQ